MSIDCKGAAIKSFNAAPDGTDVTKLYWAKTGKGRNIGSALAFTAIG